MGREHTLEAQLQQSIRDEYETYYLIKCCEGYAEATKRSRDLHKLWYRGQVEQVKRGPGPLTQQQEMEVSKKYMTIKHRALKDITLAINVARGTL